MSECISSLSHGFTNISMIKEKLLAIADDMDHRYPVTFLNKRIEERKQFSMAVQHALEVMVSIESRFVTGASDREAKGFKDLGTVHIGDENLF